MAEGTKLKRATHDISAKNFASGLAEHGLLVNENGYVLHDGRIIAAPAFRRIGRGGMQFYRRGTLSEAITNLGKRAE